MSKLSTPYPVRLTADQDKAIDMLCSHGFNRSKFIRAAVQEKLKRDFRNILAAAKEKEKRATNDPSWLYD